MPSIIGSFVNVQTVCNYKAIYTVRPDPPLKAPTSTHHTLCHGVRTLPPQTQRCTSVKALPRNLYTPKLKTQLMKTPSQSVGQARRCYPLVFFDYVGSYATRRPSTWCDLDGICS